MIETLEQLIGCIREGRLREHRESNVELKRSWDQENGKKISAFANRPSASPQWMCVGISDDGALSGRDESWAKETEERISQHLNQYLDPQTTCLGITCHDCNGQWFIVIKYANPGSVVYWNNSAYKAAGTTIELMAPEEVMKLTVTLPGLTDYSAQKWTGPYDQAKATDFARTVAEKAVPSHSKTLLDFLQTLLLRGLVSITPIPSEFFLEMFATALSNTIETATPSLTRHVLGCMDSYSPAFSWRLRSGPRRSNVSQLIPIRRRP